MRQKFPTLQAQRLPERVSFEFSPLVLARWNAALAAKDDEKDEDTTISIYDVIGYDPWTGSGVTAKRIAGALRSIGKKDVTVNINSPGGDLFEGIAIYNLLRDHPGKVTCRIVGLAASAASLIAMAGDKIQIARAGFMMIHNVWVLAIGNRNDLRDVADQLETFDDALADVYAMRTKKEKKKCAQLMDKETWFSGSQAIEGGFADEYLPADQIEEKDDGEATARRAFVAELSRRVALRKIAAGERLAPFPPARAAEGMEIRAFTLDAVKLEDRADGKGSRIVGHAAVFDKWSDDLGGFKEKISKGAFAKALKKDDVRALFNHDPNLVLGRNKAGTLTLEEDDVGLKVSIDLPDTSYARDLAVSMQRGDISQMSFAFQVTRQGQDWEKAEGGLYLRTVNEIDRLWDVSPVTYAAYAQTDAAVRALNVVRAEKNSCHHGVQWNVACEKCERAFAAQQREEALIVAEEAARQAKDKQDIEREAHAQATRARLAEKGL